jgi:hypothetical protein
VNFEWFGTFALKLNFIEEDDVRLLCFQSANLAASSNIQSGRRPLVEAASGWSNENEADDDDDNEYAFS